MVTKTIMARNLGTLAAILLLIASVVISIGAHAPVQKAVFLDVGQGDAVLFQNGSHQILIDGGEGTAVLTRLAEEMPKLDRTIDVLISTHPDKDHLEGLLHVVQRYDVEFVLLPRVPHTSQLYESWLTTLTKQLNERQIAYRFADVGQTIINGELKIRVLGPQGVTVPTTKTNNASIVTRVDFKGLSFLLTGDADFSAEQQLVSYTPPHLLDVEILKGGHHGSKTSTGPALLRATSPYAVVISVGANNTYGHPHPTVLQRLQDVAVWRTDTSGSITFLNRGKQWYVQAARAAIAKEPILRY